MMISPEMYVAYFNDKTYEDCLKERDKLIRSIRRFEKGKCNDEETMMSPAPSVIYQCELEYLSKLCMLIIDKYQSSDT